MFVFLLRFYRAHVVIRDWSRKLVWKHGPIQLAYILILRSVNTSTQFAIEVMNKPKTQAGDSEIISKIYVLCITISNSYSSLFFRF